jgi:hypothetical protein
MHKLRRRLETVPNRVVLGVILGVGALASIVSGLINIIFGFESSPEWWMGWLQNFGTEMFGAFLTFVLLELLIRGREEKGKLIRQMRSKDNALALQAVAELGAHGWLSDGSLNGANLMRANLEGVRMWDTDMVNTDLHAASLHGAKLERVNLKGANLWKADLSGMKMRDGNMEGADLMYANLTGAVFENVEFDAETRLPDGSHWSPQTDLGRFTNPRHPDFWKIDYEQLKEETTSFVPNR